MLELIFPRVYPHTKSCWEMPVIPVFVSGRNRISSLGRSAVTWLHNITPPWHLLLVKETDWVNSSVARSSDEKSGWIDPYSYFSSSLKGQKCTPNSQTRLLSKSLNGAWGHKSFSTVFWEYPKLFGVVEAISSSIRWRRGRGMIAATLTFEMRKAPGWWRFICERCLTTLLFLKPSKLCSHPHSSHPGTQRVPWDWYGTQTWWLELH